MKNIRRFLFLLLALTLVFTLFSCGECEHEDTDEDGICDKCDEVLVEESLIEDVKLIENSQIKFQMVVENEASDEVRAAVDAIVANFARLGVEFAPVEDMPNNNADVEVLVGNIINREEQYLIDAHSLGYDGYVIKIIGTKVVIAAGSDETLVHAIEEFAGIILGIDEETESMPKSVTMTADDIVEIPQTSFRITSLKIGGQDISSYTIATDTTSEIFVNSAKDVQQTIYKRTGKFLSIVDDDNADKSIIIQLVDRSLVPANGFKVSVNDKNQLMIECSYLNRFSAGIKAFLASAVELKSGEVNFTGTVYEAFDADAIYYDDYGAVGDGVTDDYVAIYNTHILANQTGQTVKATPGKTYYLKDSRIEGKATAIPIKTNVNWGSAKFIIDDRDIAPNKNIDAVTSAMGSLAIFNIESDYKSNTITDRAILDAVIAAGLNKQTTKIDLGDEFRYGAMIVPYNNSHNIYRRLGYGAYAGEAMHELIVIDKDGNVDPSTPLMWNYTKLDKIVVYRLEGVAPITVEGGEFTTRASQYNCIYTRDDGVRWYYSPYITRGLSVTRPYTTVKNVQHYVTDEAPFSTHVDLSTGVVQYVGSTYRGFFVAANTSDVLFEGCVLTGRRCYRRPNGGTGGTYDLSGNTVNKIVFKDCTQSNFWVTVNEETGDIKAVKEGTPGAVACMESFPIPIKIDNGTATGIGVKNATSQMHWGTGGTNYCKNMEYIGSTISRYDAHQGVYNGKVIDSTVCAIALTGGGDMYIENTRTFTTGGNRVFSTRSDYGYTWDGTVHVSNTDAYIHAKNSDGTYSNDIAIMGRSYKNWYFGYEVVVPSMILSNIHFYDVDDYDPSSKTYEPVPNTTTIYLFGKEISKDTMQHLEYCTTDPRYSFEDKDGDKMVDIPDHDGDGVWGNTEWKLADLKKGLSSDAVWDGFIDTETYADDELRPNFNNVIPPKFVKILGNDWGYKYHVANTAISELSNGGHNGIAENWKGFYGSTKFYYGPGENDFVQGPPTTEEELNKLKDLYTFY